MTDKAPGEDLELELRDLTKSGRVSALSGLLGVVARYAEFSGANA